MQQLKPNTLLSRTGLIWTPKTSGGSLSLTSTISSNIVSRLFKYSSSNQIGGSGKPVISHSSFESRDSTTCSHRPTIFPRKYKSIKLSVRKFGTMSNSDDQKAELKKKLTPIQFHVTQEKGTERAFTGKYNKCTDAGTYSCVVCDQPLFSSETKFDSGCGWPAFNNVLDQGKVKLTKDTSHVGANLLLLIANPGMVRTEVTCTDCGAHLGHVFGDGPPPTRKRFCINSASLQFHPADGSDQST